MMPQKKHSFRSDMPVNSEQIVLLEHGQKGSIEQGQYRPARTSRMERHSPLREAESGGWVWHKPDNFIKWYGLKFRQVKSGRMVHVQWTRLFDNFHNYTFCESTMCSVFLVICSKYLLYAPNTCAIPYFCYAPHVHNDWSCDWPRFLVFVCWIGTKEALERPKPQHLATRVD